MGNKERTRFSAGFKERAVVRMLQGERVRALAREFLVSRTALYEWRQKAEKRPGGNERERKKAEGEVAALQARIAELEAAVGRKTLELDFFQGALRRLAANGPATGNSGVKSSLPKSVSGRNRKAH